MAPIHALDQHYLAITLLITAAYQFSGFAIAWTFQFDKITDFTGGSNFFILAILTLCLGNTFYARNIVASVLIMVWATRLAGFLLFRVLKMGSDNRFDDIRSHFFKFLGFWIGQIVWVWVVSTPVTILNSPSVSDPSLGGSNPRFGTSRDIAGIVIWSIGFSVESNGDFSKWLYKSQRPPKDKPMRSGLWSWSRHPPYFGEMLCWWGIWIICISPATNGNLSFSARAALYGSVVSPVFTVLLLMFASGVPTAEKPVETRFFLMSNGADAPEEYNDAWSNYKEYVNSTSILIPIPPPLYRPLPSWLKKTLLLDFPFYHLDEVQDGPKILDEERKKLAQP